MTRVLASLLLVLALLLPSPSWAARLFTSGFEENCTTTCMWAATTGVPVIVTTTPHSGTYRLDTASTNGSSYLTYNLNAAVTSGTYSYRLYFKSGTATPSADAILFHTLSGSSVSGLQISMLTTGAIKLTNAVSTTTATSSTLLSANTWYRIEAQHLLSDTVGTMTVKLYDDALNLLETLSITGEDTLPTNIQIHRVGKSASTAVFSYDDLAINDASGSFQTTYAGPGKVYMLVPDSDVAIMWEKNGGTANDATFAQIDDLPGAPNDADYNTADPTIDINDTLVNDPIDQMGLTNPGAEVTSDATITVVAVYSRCGSNQTSAAHIKYKLWDDVSALTTGPTVNCNVNGWRITASTESLNYDAIATGKTKANLNTFNVGYEVVTDTLVARPRLISALWVNVDWTESTLSTNAPQTGGIPAGILR